MTHLSDFSFLQRMVSFTYLYIWYTYRVWTLDRFACLHPKRFKQGELKSIVTLLILFMIPFQLYYDITSVKIKYEEGFVSIFGRIFTKPEVMWTQADKNLVIPTEYSLCVGFSLQTGTLVLLQCFWNYLANSVAKASFMSSKEFMFYIFWTISSFILFPVLQYNFSRNVYEAIYKEIIPEMVYGIELFIVSCLGIVSHFRFKKLLNTSRDTVNGRSISQKIRYFQEINKVLSTVLFGHGTLLTILSIDGLTRRKTLNIHKFTADFFICNINMCAVITWLCMILIFHPKYHQLPESQNHEDIENPDDSNKQINNNSEFSSVSTYGNTPTLFPSQDSASCTCNASSIHPLSKTETISSRYDENYQYGHFMSSSNNDTVSFRKNTSVSSAVLSMSTIVEQNQNQNSSNSKVNSLNGTRSTKTSIITGNDADYFEIPIPDDKTKIINREHYHSMSDIYTKTNQNYYNNFTFDRDNFRKQFEDLEFGISKKTAHITQEKVLSTDDLDDEEYVPPPLSPAREYRENSYQSLHSEQDIKIYSPSINSAPIDADIGDCEIGKDSVIIPKQSQQQETQLKDDKSDLDLDIENKDNIFYADDFQKRQEIEDLYTELIMENDCNQTANTPIMSRSASSILLPLPFEMDNSQYDISNLDEDNDIVIEFNRARSSSNAFNMIAPPPTSSPPIPPK